MTHGYANMVALKIFKSDAKTLADGGTHHIAAQYACEESTLRPIYDALIKTIAGLGEDVELAPKKAYARVRRSKQFAIIQPSTKTRLDLGVNLDRIPKSATRFSEQMRDKTKCQTTLTDSHFAKRGLGAVAPTDRLEASGSFNPVHHCRIWRRAEFPRMRPRGPEWASQPLKEHYLYVQTYVHTAIFERPSRQARLRQEDSSERAD